MSKREQVLEALRALLTAALPAATVKRNAAKPERIPDGGLVIIRDGDPGEPEITLSPLTYIHAHRVPLEIAAFGSGLLTREQAVNQMLAAIAGAVAADRTLGGLCDFVETQAPLTDDLETTGALTGRWADAALMVTYSTSDPLL